MNREDIDQSDIVPLFQDFIRRSLKSERRELLGDKVLGLVVTEWILQENPEFNEGQATKLINYLVSKEVLVDVVNSFHFIDRTTLKTLKSLKLKRQSDFVENIISRLFKRGGIKRVSGFVRSYWTPYLNIYKEIVFNPKGELQEILGRFTTLPYYVHYRTITLDGKPLFFIYVYFFLHKKRYVAFGQGYSLKEAQIGAARQAIRIVKSIYLLT